MHRLKQDIPGAEGQQAIAGRGTEWEPVAKGVDPGNRQLTLPRGRDGGWLAVPAEMLADYFDLSVAASAGNEKALEAAIKEAMASAREMSTTRFVILPVFLAGSGVLAEQYAEKSNLDCAVSGDGRLPRPWAAVNASCDLVPFVGPLLAVLGLEHREKGRLLRQPRDANGVSDPVQFPVPTPRGYIAAAEIAGKPGGHVSGCFGNRGKAGHHATRVQE